VLPAWQRAAGERDILAGAALARELLAEDDAALEAWLDLLHAAPIDGVLDLKPLAGKPRALLRRALHRWLLALRDPVDLSRQGFTALLAAIEVAKWARHSLGTKGFAVIRSGRLVFERQKGAQNARRIPRRLN